MRYSGIAVAVVSAGVAMSLAGCGPKNLASSTGTPSGSPSASASASASGTGTGTTSTSGSASGAYQFRSLDDPADLTFNQLLGINNHDVIAGYFGSGAAGHPNKGYLLFRTAAGFKGVNENVPGSVQTQVTGLNDRGVTVGFWSAMNAAQNNDNTGFYSVGGHTVNVKFPTTNNSTPPVNQLLGVNDHNVAVGFYNDAQSNAHGYTYHIFSGRFRSVTVQGASSLTAAAINNLGDIAGFMTNAAGTTDGFLQTDGGRTTTLAYPGASMTQALGVNDFREVVGVYQVGTGNSAVTHGFTWSPRHGFKSVDDPQGVGTTTINGVNDEGQVVGFYTDGAGNTDGFAAAPVGQAPFGPLISIPVVSASPTAMPSMPPSTMMPSTSPSATTMPTSSPTSMPTSSMSPSPMPTSPTTSPMPSSSLQPTHF